MKKIVLAGAILFPLLAGCDSNSTPVQTARIEPKKPALTAEQRQSLVKTATAGMDLERDKMESISFFTAKGDNFAGTGLSAYVAVPDQSHAILRVIPHFHADSWIFFTQIKVMADDQIVYEKSFDSFKMKHDNNTAGVFESIDYPADAVDVSALRTIARAKSVTLRLSGRDKREDYELTSADKLRIARSLKAYDDLSAL